MEQYDVVFIGYPIWWGQAPKIIYTFVESYDLAGKTLLMAYQVTGEAAHEWLGMAMLVLIASMLRYG